MVTSAPTFLPAKVPGGLSMMLSALDFFTSSRGSTAAFAD
jgi:hypothetical protein